MGVVQREGVRGEGGGATEGRCEGGGGRVEVVQRVAELAYFDDGSGVPDELFPALEFAVIQPKLCRICFRDF